MFNTPQLPASSNLSEAYALLAAATDPKGTQARLDEINAATLILKQHQDAVAQGRAELEQRESDLKTKLDLFAGDKQLTDNYANALDGIKADLDKREADLQVREQNVAIVENSQRENDDRIRSKEQRAISKLNELQQRESDLNTKHSKVDETQSKLDKHLARIQSVLQPQ